MGEISWVSGVTGAGAVVVLVVGVVGAVAHRPGLTSWLVVLIDVNAGRRGVTTDALASVRAVDVVLLLLSAATYAGFWPGPGSPAVGWMGLAVAQPVLGVVLLLGGGGCRSGGDGGGAGLLLLLGAALAVRRMSRKQGS